MHPTELAYGLALRVMPAALRLATPFSTKLKRGLDGRAASLSSLRAWCAASRDLKRPLYWLHAPSVGESLMAQAILSELREREPDAQFMFTYFSPSAERISARIGADWSGYLPWDRRDVMDDVLDAAEPTAIAFVRTEIWPTLVTRSKRRDIRVTLVNAALGARSSRLRGPARALLGSAYRALDAVGAVSAEDASRFDTLGVARDRVHVTGDARFDQVWQRARAIDRERPLLRLFQQGRPWLVAGSTWRGDEERLVHALIAARASGAAWRAIFAPHEPTDEHLRQLERRLHTSGLRYSRLPDEGSGPLPSPLVDAVIVDRVGVLADLYAVAAVAYVGGGFGHAGLHSVVEPAALGLPVVFGPRFGNAQEAERLASSGGGFVVHNGEEMQDVLRRLRRDVRARDAAGVAARNFVQSFTGGAGRNAAVVRGDRG